MSVDLQADSLGRIGNEAGRNGIEWNWIPSDDRSGTSGSGADGYDGMELLKRARIQNPDMEFIIISGYSHFEYAQTAIRYGVSDYILKPVNEEALNATLQKVRQRYMEHQVLTEKNLEQKKQQVLDQARVRETLWMDLEYARIPQNMEALNEKYWYHFQEGKFRTFLIQADVKNNENLSENYADNVMELVNSKVPGLFEKLKRP